jgi:tetratricopeptide (TPR) repeat protein
MYHLRQAAFRQPASFFMFSRLVFFPPIVLLGCSFQFAYSQAAKPASSSTGTDSAQRGLELVKSGRCAQAIPLLKKAMSGQVEKSLERDSGLAGVRCAMVGNRFDLAEEFLRPLNRDFPNDPEVLYVSVHTYSDLATHASQRLAAAAPDSAQAHELNAEALEMQGKWDDAAREYQSIVQKDPRMPGIHFKIGRLLLSRTNPPPDAADRARKEFQKELELDPSNAGAEYVLGELARQAQQWDEAVRHFSRAAQIESGFGDAFLGWGLALISDKKFSDAVSPLETAVRLEPLNPAAHYNLAMAYSRTGRKQEAEKEFSIHREMVQKNSAAEGGTPPSNSQDAPR